MTTTRVQDLTNLGNVAPGDKVVGERVAGTTRSITLSGTGSGNLVFATSPTISNPTVSTGTFTSPALITPTLDTPISGVLTNCTGLPISTGVSGLATGASTFLTTPSSANLAALLTDETGSGAAVFATSPTLVTPLLGTPTSGVLTNCTGLPMTSGVTGVLPVANGGTNASSASITAFNNITGYTAAGATGTTSTNLVFSTSPTLVTPVLGTPSSGTLTSCTGLPLTTGVTGVLPVANGGTNASSASITAFNNITGYSAAGSTGTTSTNLVFSTSPTLVTPVLGTPSSGTLTSCTGLPLTSGVTGTLPIANGGTNVTSVTTSPTASAFAGWDANSNLSANNFLEGYATTATAAATTTLTVASTRQQVFTGSTTQTVTMPVVSTLALGTKFIITNLSTGVVTVQSSGANSIQAMQANSTLVLISNATSGTGASVWYVVEYIPAASGQTGSNSLVRSTSPTLVTPVLGAASATSITFTSTSGVIGTTTNDSAAAGSVGEVISSSVTSVAITSATPTNVTSISLTAGDWDVYGMIQSNPAATTTVSVIATECTTTSATFGTYYSQIPAAITASTKCGITAPFVRISVSGTTTVYLVAYITYAVSTLTVHGNIFGRRAR